MSDPAAMEHLDDLVQQDDLGGTPQPGDSDDLYSSDDDNDSNCEEQQMPEMVSDGRRMRMVWRSGDGNGDSTPHLIERSMTLVRGHPTWKIFINEIELPIVRGSENEPPRYVYLDDRACYAIYSSQAYTREEMREFWPWDFNHQGHIKQGRLNRGHPAYLDDSNKEYALGKLRAKGQWYTFSGAPEVTEYKPLRPKKPTKIEEEVAKELTEGVKQVQAPSSTSKNAPGRKGSAPRTPTSRALPSAALPHASPPQETPSSDFGLRPRRLLPRQPPPQPVPPNTRDAPPFLTSRSRTRPGSLAHLNPKAITVHGLRSESPVGETNVTSPPNSRSESGTPVKRRLAHPLNDDLGDGSEVDSSPRKRTQLSMGRKRQVAGLAETAGTE
ncbi:uncharacterized protein EI97DRAFT_432769 [Westerdykella ornata]|uniref:Uncharacterized protein n=1 Tax=Westerdykella ornata TaxID=318751 RepID=A0A6A6JQB4_WESOR|nr:uncharacterized protein EI97DRAFT_432769 [Westerdykella ornata]KAF2277159.1 hypothetical protein EI97DRAFT_432769 [Westerdykella ornata]